MIYLNSTRPWNSRSDCRSCLLRPRRGRRRSPISLPCPSCCDARVSGIRDFANRRKKNAQIGEFRTNTDPNIAPLREWELWLGLCSGANSQAMNFSRAFRGQLVKIRYEQEYLRSFDLMTWPILIGVWLNLLFYRNQLKYATSFKNKRRKLETNRYVSQVFKLYGKGLRAWLVRLVGPFGGLIMLDRKIMDWALCLVF